MKIDIYTDGSCSKNNVDNVDKEDCGGYGYCIVCDDILTYETCEMYKNTTNNRMEMRSIIAALQYCLDNYGKEHQYTVYTDSALIINTINQKWYSKWQGNGWRKADRTAVKNVDLWKEMLYLGHNWISREQIKFQKIKGHAGHKYNERADELANKWRSGNHENFIIDKESSR